MLTQIDVDSENAFTLPILGVTPKDSRLIRKVTGLSPADVQLFIGDYSRDGGLYTGRRVSKRNVVMIIDLNPNPALGETVSGLREAMYKAFLDPQVEDDYIKLTLHDDLGRQRYVVGYTEKFETEIFDAENLCQVSIICPDPYIRDELSTVMQIPGYLSSPTIGWNALPPFVYGGTAETGFEAEIRVVSDTFILNIEVNGKTMKIDGGLLYDTKLVYVNTNRGSRALYSANASDVVGTPREEMDLTKRWEDLAKAGLVTSIVDGLTSQSRWLELHSQSNSVKVYGELETDSDATIREFKFTQSYWGI